MKITKFPLRFFIVFMLCGYQAVHSAAVEPAYEIVKQWEQENIEHQPEAKNIFAREGFLYTGGGAMDNKIAKVNMETGAVAWTHKADGTYQPSYPVSNGSVVIYGTYDLVYEPGDILRKTYFIGLDDQTGKLLWKVPARGSNMTGACFAGDLAFIGSYDLHLYAIDWARGEARWKTRLGLAFRSAPVVYDKWVLVGGNDGKVYGLDRETGRVEFTIDCGGAIDTDVTVASHLLFAIVDDQKPGDKYTSSKADKAMLVVDLRQRKIVARFTTDNYFKKKIVVSGNEVFFFDNSDLYAYDAQRAELSWKFQAPRGVAPYPVLTPSHVVLPLNAKAYHGEHSSKVVVLDRATGRELSTREQGGIGIRHPEFTQLRDMIVMTDWNLTGYRISPLP